MLSTEQDMETAQPSQTCQECSKVFPKAPSLRFTSHFLTLAFVSCILAMAGRDVTEGTRLEAEAGLEGVFEGVVLEEVCRWGGMEGLAVEGEDFLNMETK